jgi:hypothetical protein
MGPLNYSTASAKILFVCLLVGIHKIHKGRAAETNLAPTGVYCTPSHPELRSIGLNAQVWACLRTTASLILTVRLGLSGLAD